MKIRFFLFLFLFFYSVSSFSEDYLLFSKSLSVARKTVKQKDEFESWQDYTNKYKIDCDSDKSILCKHVFIESDFYYEFDSENKILKFFDPFGLGSYFSENGYFPLKGKNYTRYCGARKIISRHISHHTFQNGFGALTSGTDTKVVWDGVAFEGKEKTFNLDVGCIDWTILKAPKYALGDFTQNLPMSSDDAKKENGKFFVRLEAVPIAPYFTVLKDDTGRTFTDPDRRVETGKVLLVKPIKWLLIGKKTKKIYYEGGFPNTNQVVDEKSTGLY